MDKVYVFDTPEAFRKSFVATLQKLLAAEEQRAAEEKARRKAGAKIKLTKRRAV